MKDKTRKLIKMGNLRVGLRYKNQTIFLNAKKCGYFGKIFGLMFRKKKNAEILLFDFGKKTRIPLHSFFVFFPFLAVWADDKNKVIEARIVRPFEFDVKPKKDFLSVVEIPISNNHRKTIKKFGLKERFK